MQLLQAIADYTLGQAYIVLKAIGKKKRDLMAQEEPRFKEGCIKSGLTRDQADTLWDLIQPFAGYSFNRPHSTLYGLLSYQTAYLKVNYPTEYMAAVLSAAAGTTDDVAKSVAETIRLGVAVLPADVNRSNSGFTIEDLSASALSQGIVHQRGIRFGLSAIKNIGTGPVEKIIVARDEEAPFSSLEDFCTRVDRHALNKRVVEGLIKSGAMDELPGTRRQKLAILDQALSAGIEAQKARESGQSSMFDVLNGSATTATPRVDAIPLPVLPETPAEKKEELAWEKELLGMYISEHPVAQALKGIDPGAALNLREITEELVGKIATFIGMLTGVRRITTKKGDAMLVANLEDLESSVEVVVFPKTLAEYDDALIDDAVLRVTAKVDNRRDTLQLIVESCAPIEAVEQPHMGNTALQPEMDIEGIAEGTAGSQWISNGQSPPSEVVQPPTREHAVGEMVADPPEPQLAPSDVSTPTIIRARTKVSLSSSTANGHGSSPGNGACVGETQPTVSARNLRIYLPRTDNFDADVRLMRTTDEVLRSREGNDRVMIYLPNGVGTVVLHPEYTVHLSETLVEQLQHLLGAEQVIAE